MFDLKSHIGQSPLTDPRSLGSSLLFHAVLLFVASLAALSVAIPAAPELPQVLRGELDPVDNRDPARTGGGSPGALGGVGETEVVPIAGGESAQGAARTPTGDALLAEILPTPTS